jgi:hypothetical protein
MHACLGALCALGPLALALGVDFRGEGAIYKCY